MLDPQLITATPAVSPCDLAPIACSAAGSIVGSATSSLASSAFDSICKDFADAATSLLSSFASAFNSITTFNLDSSGIGPVYGLAGGIAVLIAVFLFFGQIIRMVATRSGEPMASAVLGLARFTLSIILTISIAGLLLRLADELTTWITDSGLGGQQALVAKLTGVVHYDPSEAPALLLVFAIIGIVVTLLLYVEMLFRHAAIVVLVATAPIAAAGQIGGEPTKAWWRKLVTATIQLIFLKPVVALVFTVGFSVAGNSDDTSNLLAGVLILALAVVAWPAIASLFTFTSTSAAAAGGMGALLGFAAGRASSGSGSAGMAPSEMGSFLSQRTAARESASGAGAATGGSAATGSATAAGGGASAGAGAAAPPLAIAAAAAGAVKGAADHATAQMQNTSHHAGLTDPGQTPPSSGGSSSAPAAEPDPAPFMPAQPGTPPAANATPPPSSPAPQDDTAVIPQVNGPSAPRIPVGALPGGGS